MKKSISYDDYLRLLGLVKLGEDTCKQLDMIEHAAGRLLDAENEGSEQSPYYGHVSDVMSGSRDVNDMLRILEIVVQPATEVPS